MSKKKKRTRSEKTKSCKVNRLPARRTQLSTQDREQKFSALIKGKVVTAKFGQTRDYWTEFVFEAYVNHRREVILLAGLPDVPERRPQSRINNP
ncbi:MAG: hypothetical protein ACE5HV_11995 [Acidobacteriota bacterium]